MVELNQIHFAYNKKKPLFKDLNITFKPGSIYGLLGKNGAGKSTLLKLICGLNFPDKGKSITLGFHTQEREPTMLQEIIHIPEEVNLPSISMETYAKINGAFYPKFNYQQLEDCLSEFELDKRTNIRDLSYGQKKKFLIAFGLAANTLVLLMDEPTNGLDIPSKSQFRKMVAAAFDQNKLIIISTHQVRDLENLIDTVTIVEKGQIIFNEKMEDISSKLSFEKNTAGLPQDEILYSESNGKAGILKNTSGLETKIDLELLFNGVIKNPQLMQFNPKPIQL
jgi:ABC-2 type transport system ATP-binding protein